ncbi:MAG TPA: CPBP family intramembrane glutamic endopeptidase [Saprospiraceae bacterium]|nr:CPBP family intramembrane glutamic endopeptidase [Saprospiraceae bacterium]
MELTTQSYSLRSKTISFFKILSVAYLAMNLFNFSLSGLFELFGVSFEQPYLNQLNSTELVIIGAVIAPLLESVLIVGILWLVQLFAPRLVAMLAVGLVFGALHISPGVHWGVVLGTAIMGYLFTHFYHQTRERGLSGFWLITLLHTLNNLTAFAVNGML